MLTPGLVVVLRIPTLSTDFCFGGGIPHEFIMMDWFHDHPGIGYPDPPIVGSDRWRSEITDMIKEKVYYNDEWDYLVLHKEHSFVIEAVQGE